jgi:NAD(P)-dependent dehydrogenase (short-subunit alcohol dehydrogenase family)
VDFGLKGKVAMVTGAAQGIGSETARLLSYEGCNVALADVNFEKAERIAGEIQAKGCEAKAFHCDVSETVSVTDTVKKVREALGDIDILVNNAGIVGPYVGNVIVEMPEELG